MSRFIRTVAIAVAVALWLGSAGAALAAASDYAFEAVTKEVQAGPSAVIEVRLVHEPTGKPAEDAVIFESRLDRSPEGRADIVTHPTPAERIGGGVYRFKVDISEAGRWALKLEAKVPGEPEIVAGEMVIVATGR